MTAPASNEEGFRALWERGWQQGTLFDAPEFSVPTQSAAAKNVRQINNGKQVKPTARLILATHACDMVSSDELVVEALVCADYGDKPHLCSRADGKSARFFLVDPLKGMVAIAMQRILIVKQSLEYLTPLGWPSDDQRRERFKRWLARRYDRPAWPDGFQELFVSPMDQALTALETDERPVWDIVNRVCKEWRVALSLEDLPPFQVSLLMVLSQDGLSIEEAEAFGVLEERIRASLDEERVHLIAVRKGSLRQFNAEEFYGTAPLFLEPHTYQGDETIGGEPLSRV